MMEFQFEERPWETYLRSCKAGTALSAWNFISMLEAEDDEAVDEAFDILTERHLLLDLSTLPTEESGSKMAQRLKQEAEYAGKGLQTSDMDEGDPLRLYLEEVNKTDSEGNEEDEAARYLSGKDGSADKLLNLGLKKVIEIALEYAGKMVLLSDLIQDGNIGLWNAIQSYCGGDYASHRDFFIRSALAKAMVLQARSSGISRKMSKALEDYRSADEALLTQLGRNPSLEEIAEKMGISPEQAQIVQKTMSDIQLVQQAQKLSQPKEESQEDELPVEDTAYFQMRQRIGDLLSRVDERDAKILTLRFGLDKGLPMSAAEVGKEMGLTAQEVTARETAALAALRSEQ